jgi:phosphoribosylformimino-5-aminoimidazole carboxamide ribotide isomerase
MKIIPVLDVKDGIVVRGVGGQREDYRPIVSQLADSCQPLEIARAFREELGLRELYLADLDAIAGAAPAWRIYADIQDLGCRLCVDAGVREISDARALWQHGMEHIVIGLETVAGPEVLRSICEELGAERIIFSLDLRDGKPLGRLESWKETDPFGIARQAIAIGVNRLIILDLARVGVGQGAGTEELCRRLADGYPEVEIIAGGGIRDASDLDRLGDCGVKAVLVASALHDGRLRPGDWQRFQAGRHS